MVSVGLFYSTYKSCPRCLSLLVSVALQVLDRLLRDASDLDAVVSANTVFDVVLMDIMMQRSNVSWFW